MSDEALQAGLATQDPSLQEAIERSTAETPLNFFRGENGEASKELVGVFFLVIFLLMLPSVQMFAMKGWPSFSRKMDRLSDTLSRGGCFAHICNGLYIDFSRLPTVYELIAVAEANPDLARNDARAYTPIGPYSDVCEIEVRERYKGRTTDDALSDKVVLILKLALGLFACGHCSVDVELFIGDAAAALELPTPYISVGHRVLDVSFGSFGPHQLRCGRDLVFSGLADLTSLCTAIANGDCRSAHVGLRVCDELLERPLPYGWLVQILAFEGIGILASVVAYHGSVPYDTLGAAVNTSILIAAMHVGKLFRISHLELMLVCFAVGVGAPFVWHYLSSGGQPICHIGPQFIGPLLIHLPGCQIIWGSLEIAGGSLIHGGSRMINGMFQAMLMAIFITLGWQFFGRHWALGDPTVHPNDGVQLEGSLTSLPPSMWCPAPWQVPTEGVPEVVTWYFVHTVVALPLLALINVNLNIRPRESLGPLACGLCGTVTTGFLAFGLPTAASIPSYLQNIIVSFVTASAGNAVEFYTGLSSVVCVVPALFVFAPGSAAMMACIGSFHRDAGVLHETMRS